MYRLSLTPTQRIVISCLVALVAFLVLGHSVAFAAEASAGIGGLPSDAVYLGGTGLVGLYTWVANSQRVLQSKHDAEVEALGKRIARNRQELEDRIKNVEQRLTRAEEAAKHVPTAAQITDLIKTIGDLRADVREQSSELGNLRGEVSGLSRRFDNYETHMLEARQ